MKHYLIIGFGWLGKELALHLKEQGKSVWATTTNHEKVRTMESLGIHPLLIPHTKTAYQNRSKLPNFEAILVCLPPFEGAIGFMDELLQGLHFKQLIFTSSTGIYRNSAVKINEEAPIEEQHLVAKMEQFLRQKSPQNFTCFRLAGHFGNGRHPLFHLVKSQRVIENGEAAINLVHQNDIIRAIQCAIDEKLPADTYNLCFPAHPKKMDYYGQLARKVFQKNIEFSLGKVGKTIDGSKICQKSEFQYKHSIHEFDEFDLKNHNI